MPRLGPRARATAFLLLRLAIFALVTWWAIHWILLRGPEEHEVKVVAKQGFSRRFRTLGATTETNGFRLFGKEVLKVTRTREEVQGGSRRAGKGRALIWIKEGDEFYPHGRSGATFTTEGTNFVDYAVLAPNASEWMFKVEHQIRRKYELGPFRFELRPKNIIYKSPVMMSDSGFEKPEQSSEVK